MKPRGKGPFASSENRGVGEIAVPVGNVPFGAVELLLDIDVEIEVSSRGQMVRRGIYDVTIWLCCVTVTGSPIGILRTAKGCGVGKVWTPPFESSRDRRWRCWASSVANRREEG